MNISNPGELLETLPIWLQSIAGLAMLTLAVGIVTIIMKKVILRAAAHGLKVNTHLASHSRLITPIAGHIANIVPAMMVSRCIEWVPHLPGSFASIIRNCASAFVIVMIVLTLSALLNLAGAVYQQRPSALNHPIKGYLQVAKMILFGCGAILAIAALMEQSPTLLLSGLGAMAAILMLVFKDTILSFVASVQLTSNDMLRVGDWIEMRQANADGDVIDIALHTITVQNWDKTVTNIPTYRMISESYRNWRNMSESGGRRIKRCLYLDQSCVRFLTRDEKSELSRFALLKPYLLRKERELERWNTTLNERGLDSINYRALTNVGTFRAYIQAYIEAHPSIHQGMTRLVRQLEPTTDGLPVEIYCFANTVEWIEYEAIQADLVDHLLAILPHFGLRPFQHPAGNDLHDLATVVNPPRDIKFAHAR
ncbi:MAG: mechanosensitive ion channel [Rhodospirillaceae bacterium]|nr:mechanosensitive ion channel [Rhodospirillaceae bacterium]